VIVDADGDADSETVAPVVKADNVDAADADVDAIVIKADGDDVVEAVLLIVDADAFDA
jgi:Cu/Zn superoxide dismutase